MGYVIDFCEASESKVRICNALTISDVIKHKKQTNDIMALEMVATQFAENVAKVENGVFYLSVPVEQLFTQAACQSYAVVNLDESSAQILISKNLCFDLKFSDAISGETLDKAMAAIISESAINLRVGGLNQVY